MYVTGTPLDQVAVTEVLEETVTVSAAISEKLAAAVNPLRSRFVPVNVIDSLSDDRATLVTDGIEVEVAYVHDVPEHETLVELILNFKVDEETVSALVLQ